MQGNTTGEKKMKIKRDTITVRNLLEDKKDKLKLKLVGGKEGLHNEIKTNSLFCPGLLLTGFKKHFEKNAIQILGKQTIAFLNQLTKEEKKKSLSLLLNYSVPCLIVSDNLKIPHLLIKSCDEKKIPILITKTKQCEIVHEIIDYIESKTSAYIYVHGTLVDVYGVGILFTGKSGIGKSETALDLVARGHRLVADDLVKVTKRKPEILMGVGKEPLDLFRSHLEIRGIGVIDISKIFGVRAIRLHKRVEVEVHLIKWGLKKNIDRTGLEVRTKTILGVRIPYKIIPLVPGKNISVLSETVALEHLLKLYAYDTPRIFNKKLLELMKKKGKEYAQLDKDNE